MRNNEHNTVFPELINDLKLRNTQFNIFFLIYNLLFFSHKIFNFHQIILGFKQKIFILCLMKQNISISRKNLQRELLQINTNLLYENYELQLKQSLFISTQSSL